MVPAYIITDGYNTQNDPGRICSESFNTIQEGLYLLRKRKLR